MSLYERLPDNVLADFYFEIQKNLNRGISTERMNHELTLIKSEAEKRGLSISSFHFISKNYYRRKSHFIYLR